MPKEVSGMILFVSLFSSVGEREDWFHTLSRAIADHAAGLCTFGGPCSEVRSNLACLVQINFMKWFQIKSVTFDELRIESWNYFHLVWCAECVHRHVRSCGWPLARLLLYSCQFHMWWCAWIAPLTSASHWDGTTATPVARSALGIILFTQFSFTLLKGL